jgi:hypothetical protein
MSHHDCGSGDIVVGNRPQKYWAAVSKLSSLEKLTLSTVTLLSYSIVPFRIRRMKLTVKTLKGEKFQLEVDESRTVEEVKGLIVSYVLRCLLSVFQQLYFSAVYLSFTHALGSRKGGAVGCRHETHSQRQGA